MKYLFMLLVVCLFANTVKADVGCSTYNGLYPNAIGNKNPLTGNPNYYNTGYIAFRYYDQDPNCGIRDNKISLYSPFTYCDVSGIRNYGVLVTYNPADNSCMKLPLDHTMEFALPLFAAFAFLTVRKYGSSNV